MKIVILGGGKVGETIATELSKEKYDVTLVDHNESLLARIQEKADIKTVSGIASSPEVLIQAGIRNADVLLAVINSDETNMVACQVAHTLFKTKTKIARIRSNEYLLHPELFSEDSIPIDKIIIPEQAVTSLVSRLIEHPGALQVVDFAKGKIRLVGLKTYKDGALVGHEIRDLKEHLPAANARIVAIYRKNKVITPTGHTKIIEGDEVFFIALSEDIASVIQELRSTRERNHNIIIAGAGNIGLRLAESLEGKYNIKLIEQSPQRVRYVAERLTNTQVLEGDASDTDLIGDYIADTEIFCAVTSDNEANMLSASLAKKLGAHRTMALIDKSQYLDLAESLSLCDIVISPKQATVSEFLAHVRKGDVLVAYSLKRGSAEIIEAVLHGNKNTSKLVGKKLSKIKWPKGSTIAAIMRFDALLPIGEPEQIVLQEEDHLVIFVTNKDSIPEIEKMIDNSSY